MSAGFLACAATRRFPAALCQALLKEGADVNAVTKLRGSPLHAAAMHGSPALVKILLDG